MSWLTKWIAAALWLIPAVALAQCPGGLLQSCVQVTVPSANDVVWCNQPGNPNANKCGWGQYLGAGLPGAFSTLSASGAVSGAGFTNLFASPPAIGGTVPAAGTFTSLSGTSINISSTVTGVGFSGYLAAPPAIGSVTPGTGAFSTLSASSTVSGTGFQTYLASPPAIGGTVANTGKFTTLQATGAITPSQTSGIVGTTTNNNANAGSVGEFVSANVLVGSAVNLVTNTATDIASISLSAGDWDVSGSVVFTTTGGLTLAADWVSTTSATLPTNPNNGAENLLQAAIAGNSTLPTGMTRLSLSSTTTVYLSAEVTIGTGTSTGYGFIRARRVR